MRILVTGSSGGIGSAFTAAATAAGHEVFTLDRAGFAALDTAPLPSCIDAVVFATGTCPVAPLRATTDELFAETFRVNCTLFLALMRRIVAQRLYSPLGMRAIAISSVSAVEGWAGGAAYCASKGALSALCRALAVELAPKRISVTVLEPRHVRTRMFANCAGRMGAERASAIAPEDFAAQILSSLQN